MIKTNVDLLHETFVSSVGSANDCEAPFAPFNLADMLRPHLNLILWAQMVVTVVVGQLLNF